MYSTTYDVGHCSADKRVLVYQYYYVNGVQYQTSTVYGLNYYVQTSMYMNRDIVYGAHRIHWDTVGWSNPLQVSWTP